MQNRISVISAAMAGVGVARLLVGFGQVSRKESFFGTTSISKKMKLRHIALLLEIFASGYSFTTMSPSCTGLFCFKIQGHTNITSLIESVSS